MSGQRESSVEAGGGQQAGSCVLTFSFLVSKTASLPLCMISGLNPQQPTLPLSRNCCKCDAAKRSESRCSGWDGLVGTDKECRKKVTGKLVGQSLGGGCL